MRKYIIICKYDGVRFYVTGAKQWRYDFGGPVPKLRGASSFVIWTGL